MKRLRRFILAFRMAYRNDHGSIALVYDDQGRSMLKVDGLLLRSATVQAGIVHSIKINNNTFIGVETADAAMTLVMG